MPHDYEAGESPEEIHAFADYYLKSGEPLVKIRALKRKGDSASITYEAKVPVLRAELNYTLDSNSWNKRVWSAVSAQLDPAKHTARVTIPKGVTAFYFDLIDQRNLIVSSDLQGPD
jgi:hypothetical protein